MKKFVMGLIVGIAITAAGSTYAEEITSLVGKTIQGQFPVKVAGVQLTEQAVVIDGTSYLPVRAIGEAMNMDVSFNADLGIELKEKEGITLTDSSQVTEITSIVSENTVQEKIEELIKKIVAEQNTIDSEEVIKKKYEDLSKLPGISKEESDKWLSLSNEKISTSKQKISDYESQIAALEAQK